MAEVTVPMNLTQEEVKMVMRLRVSKLVNQVNDIGAASDNGDATVIDAAVTALTDAKTALDDAVTASKAVITAVAAATPVTPAPVTP